MKDIQQVMCGFMKNLTSGKFQRETYPNPPPYYDGEDNKFIKDLQEFFIWFSKTSI